MKVSSTANAGKRLRVASSVTRRILFINTSSGMKRLMNITNVMNNQSQGK
jgi:hypothetical protein